MTSKFTHVRFAATLLAIFFVAAAPVAPGSSAAPPNLDELLAKVRRASGEPYRYHIVSHARELVENRALEIRSESEGLRYLTRRCAGALCSGFYSDGERAFETNLNDTPLPSADALLFTLRMILSYGFTDPAYRRGGGRLVELPPAAFGPGAGLRIAVAPAHGMTLDAVIDPVTSLVESASTRDGQFRFTFHQERSIDGKVTIPFDVDLNDKPFERFDLREIVPGPLEAPVGLVPQIEGSAVTAKLLRYDPLGDVPILECTIGGQTVPCLLDTGNSGMSMSLELAESLGIEAVGTAFEINGMGSYATGVAKAPPLSIGSGVTYPSAYYVLLHDIHRFGFDLVLGTDAFATTRLTIDYPKREVTFAPASGGELEHPIPLTFRNFVPIVRVGLDAEPPIPMLLDTGDESTINLAYAYYQAHPVFKATRIENVAGVGGSSVQVSGEIPSVTLGEFAATHQRIGATKKSFPTGQGHVGSGFLSHFRVTFDYTHARIGLSP